MRVAALVAAAACAVGQCAAQCTLPATLPPNTVLATTNPGECVLGGEIADGSECEVQCEAGQAQGAGGYSYICAGVDLTEPTPDCTDCPEDTYGDTPGLADCTPCPENSGTDGLVGAALISQCLCDAGHTGALTTPGSTCDVCGIDTYKETVGPDACTACVENSGTDGAVAQTAVTDCLCDAGYENELTTPASTCDACAIGTWLGEVGPGPCTPCTANAVTLGAIYKRLVATRACSADGAAIAALRRRLGTLALFLTTVVSVGFPVPEPHVHYARCRSACLQTWVRQPSQTACAMPDTRVTSPLRNRRAMPVPSRRTRKALRARGPAWHAQ